MAIQTTDSYIDSVFDHTFEVTSGDADKLTRTTDVFQQAPKKTTVTIIATGLDSPTRVTFKIGSSETFSKLGSWLDADDSPIIIDVIVDGNESYPVNVDAPIVGFEFEKLLATTGTVEIQVTL